MEILHNISVVLVTFILPLAITSVAALLAKILASKEALDYAKSLGDKAAAEANQALAQADHINNVLLQAAVQALVAYAVKNEPKIANDFKTKSDFVIARINADPRFAPLGVSAEELEVLAEATLAQFFQGVANHNTVPASVAPVNVVANVTPATVAP